MLLGCNVKVVAPCKLGGHDKEGSDAVFWAVDGHWAAMTVLKPMWERGDGLVGIKRVESVEENIVKALELGDGVHYRLVGWDVG